MLPIYTSETLRKIETIFAKTYPDRSLIEEASQAAFHWINARFNQDTRILIVAGRGNNGSDAICVAAECQVAGFNCTLLSLQNPEKMGEAAALAYADFTQAEGKLAEDAEEEQHFDLIIDGLFGTGLNRAPQSEDAAIINWINAQHTPVLALDIPSGLNPATGVALGASVQADWTLSFIGLKAGLLTGRDASHAGEIHLASLDIDAAILQQATQDTDYIHSMAKQDVVPLIPMRQRAAHKGIQGNVGILGGANGMTGAGILAGRAAIALGAGKVWVGFLDSAPSFDPIQPELMLCGSALLFTQNLQVLAIGCGLGQSAAALQQLDWALRLPIPIILDADALNLLASHSALQSVCISRTASTLFTPHPAEAARLLNTTTDAIENNRINSAQQLAKIYQATVILKGAGSVIAFTDGEVCINTSGNSALANAGQGDALTGMLAALIAQGLSMGDAALLGTFVHGAGADRAVRTQQHFIGLAATDTIKHSRACLNDWLLNSISVY